mmetsp:Transcript_1842/g.2573  ORF Transcript_1842/g.2573 Transcript_1842/m.2573 type:complete len:211 (-) Transcript_1842:148-780(-)|eukprot:CAMPEP_0167761926 /NCGR_PEP_ID=MMETSP0110_2-20121227/12454_1 /TAXON_ID=629695 /ORGANISM="Gymnochlora sp., Strain CCMP2014" /LENGTH=210 /DNA_ID=CAMNT_0007648685 /DNA_START=14 /DNA_END=646 /DNA_ORIENTATION=-
MASHKAIEGKTADMVPVKRALISVFDKKNVESFAKVLTEFKVEILSTGGTARKLKAAGIPVTMVKDYTGAPEILNGRVKTLNPHIHGGLLAVRGNKLHEEELEREKIGLIDMVVCNLYPFEQTVAKGGDWNTCIENIDIGGPSMIRSAAKNSNYVAIVSSPSQYDDIIDSLKKNKGCTSLAQRKKLACAAFTQTAEYDTAISNYMKKNVK